MILIEAETGYRLHLRKTANGFTMPAPMAGEFWIWTWDLNCYYISSKRPDDSIVTNPERVVSDGETPITIGRWELP